METEPEIFENKILESECSEKYDPTIKHLVIASGLIYGLSFYGALKECAIKNVYNIDNIETIYATSAGTIVAVLISLKYDWESIDNYIINRPWNRVFPININTIINALQSCGILDVGCIRELFLPLFSGREIDIGITMAEFREFTGIDFHFIATRLDTFETFDINALSCPNWTVIDAAYASCAVPILFQPFVKDGVKYADGAFLAKYPIHQCLSDPRVLDEAEILAISLAPHYVGEKITESESKDSESKDSESIIFSPMLHYIYSLLLNLVKKISVSKIPITNEIEIIPKEFQLNDIYSAVNSKEEREKLIQMGVDSSRAFIDKLSEKQNPNSP
jgi:predicted acylesterase/phospholipase RssA